jgi:predicted nucleotidyltransferase
MPAEPKLDILARLLMAIEALEAWFAAGQVRHAFIGGLAVAFRGDPRVTQDVDAIVETDMDSLREFLEQGARFGFEGRLVDTLGVAHQTLVLQLVHRDSGVNVDLSLAFTDFERQAIAAAGTVKTKGITLPVVITEDLLVMKAFARRTKDLADITGILNRNPTVNLEAVRTWLELFDIESDEPPYLAAFDDLVARWRLRG